MVEKKKTKTSTGKKSNARKKTTKKTNAGSAKKATKNATKENEFIEETKESILEGLKIVSEEAKYLEKIISTKVENAYKSVREKTTEVVESGVEFSRDTFYKALSVVENYKDKQEIKKLLDDKKQFAQELGLYAYLTYSLNKDFPEDFFRDKDVKETMEKIEKIEREIIKKAEEIS